MNKRARRLEKRLMRRREKLVRRVLTAGLTALTLAVIADTVRNMPQLRDSLSHSHG